MRSNNNITTEYGKVPHIPIWDIVSTSFPKPKIPIIGDPPELLAPFDSTLEIYCCPSKLLKKTSSTVSFLGCG